jgi:hypothetical protein
MLPEFPKFKKLELSDREDIEKITHVHAPHSDYNFMSMWAWDVKNHMEVSTLNNNLVVKFTDYITSEPFYSFLGKNKPEETAETLLNHSIENELKPTLNLMPHDSIENIDKRKFRVEKDHDNFDYIYDLTQISTYKGGKFSDKRTMINSFVRKHGIPQIKILDLKNLSCQSEIIELNHFWLQNKIKEDANFKIKNEFIATKKFLQASFHDTLGVGIYLENKLIGYSIFNILPGNFAICHFSKADINYDGVYEYLMRECAIILLGYNCVFLNYMQDLGIPGLRRSKTSFRPIEHLKKYIVKNI